MILMAKEEVPKVKSTNRLPRRQRRRLERERRKRERNPKRARNLMRKGRGVKGARAPQKRPTIKATIAGATQAKQKAEASIKILQTKLIELQTRANHFTGLRRNVAFDTIDKIHKRIEHTKDLIEVYDEWLKRKKTIENLALKVKKNAPK